MTHFIPEELNRYCYWQTEREAIRIKKESGDIPAPWTDDPILKEFKFCQVFREDDRTTRWFRNHIREPIRNHEDVLMATIIFRWFNLIETGRTLIENNLLHKWDRRKAITEVTKQPKWITGAYIIKTPNGMDKVTGVAECVSHIWKAKESILERLHERLVKDESSLEATWLILRDYPYMGPFMAYEIVTDLRHTYLLENATDILTWANAGPGAMRGLNRLTGRPLEYSRRGHPWCEEMQELFQEVKDRLPSWVAKRNDRPYEMREIEGGLCEFDKYSRIYKKEGRTRSIYKHNDLPMIEDLIEGESKYG